QLPLRRDPLLALEPVQGGVERPGVDLQDVARARLDGLGDAVAVLRPPAEGFEDQEIERALEQLDAVLVARGLRHGCRQTTPMGGDCLQPRAALVRACRPTPLWTARGSASCATIGRMNTFRLQDVRGSLLQTPRIVEGLIASAPGDVLTWREGDD